MGEVNPAANDLVYSMVMGLRASESARWEATLLEAYHAKLLSEAKQRGGAASAAASGYTLAALKEDFKLMGCVLLVVQACFTVMDVFKGWGNNKKNVLPWMVRLCRYTMRLNVPLLCRALNGGQEGGDDEEVSAILASMQQRASDGLERLRAEHGADEVDAL